ncbi:TetR family transcriptional regulator [Nocardia donostiensis]|uniref:TetR family transcriptional regulator n=1 Tax=Nocardia donostiensis TaxID=1538463 RepID=UPI0020CA9861|nr:TetR family transcriptional regulator [Nocardia donostiensis]
MSARGEILEHRLLPAICDAVEKAAASLDITGVRALRVLLHAGLSAYWPLIQSSPEQQVLAYEEIVRRLRRHWETTPDGVPDPVASAEFRAKGDEICVFLELCAQRSGTQWLEPVDSIAAYSMSVIQGTVLRWLADCDDETILVVFDDLVSSLATKAVAV